MGDVVRSWSFDLYWMNAGGQRGGPVHYSPAVIFPDLKAIEVFRRTVASLVDTDGPYGFCATFHVIATRVR